MRIKSLELQSFRSFGQKERIEFPERGLVLLDGVDKATGESSGSGKSSLLEAVAFALGYSQMPATELQCRHSDEPLQVVLTLDTADGEVVLSRGAKTSYVYKGEKHTGAKEYSEFLLRLFGMQTDLVRALTYRAQREVGKFVSMPDSEKKEFLGMCIPELEVIEREAERARVEAERHEAVVLRERESLAARREELGRHLQNDPAATIRAVDPAPLSAKIDELQAKKRAGIEALTLLGQEHAASVADIKTAAYSFMQAAMAEAAPRRDSAKAALAEHEKGKERVAKEIADTVYNIKTAEAERKSALDEVEGRLSSLRGTYGALMGIYASKPTLEAAAEEAHAEAATLRGNVCPTCNRAWEESQGKAALREDEARGIFEKVRMCDEALSRARGVEAQISAAEAEKAAVGSEKVERLRANHLALVQTQSGLRSYELQFTNQISRIDEEVRTHTAQEEVRLRAGVDRLEARIAAAQAEHLALCRELTAAAGALEQAEQKNREIKNVVLAHEMLVRSVRDTISDQEAKILALEAEGLMESAVHKCLGRSGYMGSIFDEILDEIGQETTRIVSSMPNTHSVSIAFASCTETKKGSAKKAIAPVICKDGLQASLRSLSGGQQTTIELAADLAIGTVVARRTGRMPGWLALDEAFDGMGIPTKEICMEVLRRYAKDRLVLVVDHATEIKEAFDSSIMVEMEGGNSRLVR